MLTLPPMPETTMGVMARTTCTWGVVPLTLESVEVMVAKVALLLCSVHDTIFLCRYRIQLNPLCGEIALENGNSVGGLDGGVDNVVVIKSWGLTLSDRLATFVSVTTPTALVQWVCNEQRHSFLYHECLY